MGGMLTQVKERIQDLWFPLLSYHQYSPYPTISTVSFIQDGHPVVIFSPFILTVRNLLVIRKSLEFRNVPAEDNMKLSFGISLGAILASDTSTLVLSKRTDLVVLTPESLTMIIKCGPTSGGSWMGTDIQPAIQVAVNDITYDTFQGKF